jgi:succinate-semialdehyde dehydrogenase/glutarate-semialdehyde dehydrogenase
MIFSINPATGETIATFDEHGPDAVEAALEGAARAQRQWAAIPIDERVKVLTATAELLRSNRDQYARLITLEMGKPIPEAEAEIDKCALTCDFYAGKAQEFLADEPVATSASESMIVFDPLGVVLAIMPWNYPFWQFFRFVAPALAAGNGAILKHANNVPQCALAIEEVLKLAGVPEGLCRTLLVDTSLVAGIIDDDRIAAVTLTGSTQVGSLVASQAGRVLKRQVLELGGSDPFIVLADADIQAAARTAVKARFSNVGQSCISAKRFIVEDSVAEEFATAFIKHASNLVVGDPMDRKTTIGPLARDNLRQGLHDQVGRSVRAGARLALGGAFVDGPGFFYQPTVLDGVTPGMAAFREETFGPAAAIIRVPDAEAAIGLANLTEFGLGAGLWTGDLDRAKRLVRRIEAGAVFVNAQVASDPRMPFGGIKKSGYGRELGSYGMREFTNIKTVWIGTAEPAKKFAE